MELTADCDHAIEVQVVPAKRMATSGTPYAGSESTNDGYWKVQIRISDKKKENMVELKTEAGEMTVKCKSRLTVQVGDSIKITLNGESGSVSVSAKEFSVKTSGSVQLKTDSMLKLEGAQFNAKASSVFKVESSGMVNVSGSTIKLG